MPEPNELDDWLYLMGDEGCGIGLQCRQCDRGGLPIAYYMYPEDRTYAAADDVRVVHAIYDLISEGLTHVSANHSA